MTLLPKLCGIAFILIFYTLVSCTFCYSHVINNNPNDLSFVVSVLELVPGCFMTGLVRYWLQCSVILKDWAFAQRELAITELKIHILVKEAFVYFDLVPLLKL